MLGDFPKGMEYYTKISHECNQSDGLLGYAIPYLTSKSLIQSTFFSLFLSNPTNSWISLMGLSLKTSSPSFFEEHLLIMR